MFFVPFIKDSDGKSPLHLCMETKNFKIADIILSNLTEEGLDNHGRAIFDVLPDVIRNGLPSIGTYLDARFKKTEQLK